MTRFISATYHPDILTVEYVAENGDHLLRSGGTIAWRFNNPGNLRPGSKYTLHIGKGKTKSGVFLIFPTTEAGRTEKKGLLLRKYKDDSVTQMMELYAPRIENDTDKYVDYITAKSGIDKEAIVGRLSEAELSALMQAMEQYEGFNAKADTRKETWVRTTKITLSDGARPISGQEVTIKQGSTTIQHKTNTYGQLPAIPHVSPDENVEVWIKNAANELEKIDSFVLGKASQAFTYFTEFFSVRATTRAHLPARAREKKKPTPFLYVVQPGDTVGKIAKKFKTNVQKIGADNKLKHLGKIFPGQRLSINGASPTPDTPPTAKSGGDAGKPINITAIPARSKEGQGHPLAIIPSDQKRAPWMEVAITEARKWAGKTEDEIDDTQNYHSKIGVSGSWKDKKKRVHDFKSMNNDAGSPWCASFINYCLKTSGNPFVRSASSQFATQSNKFTKLSTPIYGSIIVWKKGGEGHVAFVYGKDTVSGEVIALGGNQNDRITFMLEADTTKKLVGYYVPNTYLEFSKKEEGLAEYDISGLNKEIGYTEYRRKKQTGDR